MRVEVVVNFLQISFIEDKDILVSFNYLSGSHILGDSHACGAIGGKQNNIIIIFKSCIGQGFHGIRYKAVVFIAIISNLPHLQSNKWIILHMLK